MREQGAVTEEQGDKMRKRFAWKRKIAILLSLVLLLQMTGTASATELSEKPLEEVTVESVTEEPGEPEASELTPKESDELFTEETEVVEDASEIEEMLPDMLEEQKSQLQEAEGTEALNGVTVQTDTEIKAMETRQRITGFAEWTEEERCVIIEPKLSLPDVIPELGENIWVYLDGSTEAVPIEVDWECTEDYENLEAGIYYFRPVWDNELYPMADIAVAVPEKELSVLDELYTIPPLTYMPVEGEADIASVTMDGDYDGPVYFMMEPRYSPIKEGEDGRLTNDLPEIRNQSPYGTCWAFASLGMGELGHAVRNKEYIDLSELHFAYFTYNTQTDPLGGLAGDVNRQLGSDFMNRGGNIGLSYPVLMSWTGAAAEETAPYGTAAEALKNGLDSAIAFEDRLHLQGVYKISLEEDRELAKQMIKEYGGLGVSYWQDSQYYNSTYQSYYASDENTQNHAVMLVGWDDDFPKENFNQTPEGNGAWLIRNSWGGTNTRYSNYTYFWISYYDTSLLDAAYVFEYENADNYEHNYQYDGAMQGNNVGTGEKKVIAANVFTAKAENGGMESLKAASFETGCVNADYEIKIYTNLKGDDPSTGTLVESATTTGKTTCEGYYTVPLKKEVVLEAGTKFAVVVSLTKESGSARIRTERTLYGGWYSSEASAEAGQSYIYFSTGEWYDYGNEYDQNLRIKAFTDSYTAARPITDIRLDITEKEIKKGETFRIHASVTPEDTDNAVQWKSSDNKVATVGKDGTVTGIAAGTAIITAYSGDIIRNCTVTVTNPAASVTLNKTSETIRKGQTFTLTATVEPFDSTDKLRWTSSDTGTVTVNEKGMVTGVKGGTAIITASAGTASARCTVTVTSTVASVALNTTAMDIMLGERTQLKAAVSPSEAAADVIWSSSDDSIVSVDVRGNIRGISTGKAVITATVENKSAACTVKVLFPFSDVPGGRGSWKYDSISYVYANGIMNGISGTDWFFPDEPLTRAMFATVLYRMAGSPETAYSSRFPDVADGKWYSKAIIWANNKGIVNGFSDGTYGIDDNITREQIAKMLYEYAGTQGYDISASSSIGDFTDADEVNGWAVGYMRWATGVGMITGKPNGDGSYRLDPKGDATRAECAAMLMRFEKKYK